MLEPLTEVFELYFHALTWPLLTYNQLAASCWCGGVSACLHANCILAAIRGQKWACSPLNVWVFKACSLSRLWKVSADYVTLTLDPFWKKLAHYLVKSFFSFCLFNKEIHEPGRRGNCSKLFHVWRVHERAWTLVYTASTHPNAMFNGGREYLGHNWSMDWDVRRARKGTLTVCSADR